MKNRSRLITWDSLLLVGVIVFLSAGLTDNYQLIIGLLITMVLANVIKNHVDFYKRTGKIY